MIGVGVVAAVLAVLLAGRTRPRRRVVDAVRGVGERGNQAPQTSRSPMRIAAAALVLLVATAAIRSGPGLAVGVVAAGLIAVAPPRRRREVVPPDEVALVIDLVAGCLDAGATLPQAIDAAGIASRGLLRERCVTVASAMRAGATGAEAWQDWFADPSLAGFARTAARTSLSGAAAAADLRRAATRLRAQRRARAQQRVHQASVWLVVPLGLCFLPAFVLVAVVPIVLGLFPALHL